MWPMSSTKVGRNDPCPCGSGKKYKACCLVKEEQQRSPAPPPVDESTRRRLMDAFQAYQQDRLDEASTACAAVLQRFRNQPDALHLQGLIAQRRGNLDDALALIDRALGLAPNDSMYSNRGIVLQALGRLDEAAAAYVRALELNPQSAAVYCNLGSCMQAQGKWDQAVPAFQACLRLVPRHAAALNGLGFCYLSLERLPEAEAALQAAAEADPQFANARTNLGVACWATGKLDDAIAHYRASLVIDPSQAEVWDRIGVALGDINQTQEARSAFERAFELDPHPIRRLRKSLLLSHIFSSHEDMHAQRQRFEAGLEELIAADEQIPTVNSHAFCPAIFNLAYHGDDVLPVLRRVATMYETLCPSLRSRAPHVDLPREPGKPIRLGFFTAHVFDHPVSHCFSGLVKTLALDPVFEVVLISYRDLPTGDVKKPYEGFAGQFVKISKQHDEARRTIAGLELDILAYQDIGMDDMSYFMAYARLARIQCVLSGHPATTGLPEMDFYVSSALCEYEGSEQHYSERLVSLDPGIALFEKPKLPAVFKERVSLGLPAQGNLYVCPMMLQKIHPDFDAAVAEILSLDTSGYVVFFEHPNAGWERDLKARLHRCLGNELSARLIFLPWIKNRDDFAAINHHAAVVLDPFHFGIGSTSITVFAVGTPIVTWPATFMRGRSGLCYASVLDLPECVAESKQSYPALAVRLANDAPLRADLRRRILANGDCFYGSSRSLETTRAFFHSLAKLDSALGQESA
jgi:protein O-GlcNAc transferase